MRFGSWVLAIALWAPAVASAEGECNVDSDCPNGQKCNLAPCAQPTCAPGQECPPVKCESNGFCDEPYKPKLWGPECKADADCPFAFTCETQEQPCANVTTPACDCPPCEPGKACPECSCPTPPEPEPCTPSTTQLCVFKPKDCKAESDCDAGFECHENKVCSGGGSTGCACAGCLCPECPPGQTCDPCDCPPPEECKCESEPAPPDEETCTVEGAWCLPKEVKCAADAECPKDWSCKEIQVGSDCAVSGGAATDCACPPCAPGETCPECTCGEPGPAPEPCEEKTEKYCLPAGWEQVDLAASGGEGSGVALGLPKDAASQQDNAAPEGGDNTPNPPSTPTPGSTSATGTDNKSSSSCAASTSAAEPVAIALLLALAFLGLAVRRRTSRAS